MLSTFAAVRHAGFEITVAAPPCGPLAEALAEHRVAHQPFTPFTDLQRRLDRDALRERLARLIDAERPDLVHANSLSMGRLSGPVCRRLKVPSLAHLRDIVRLSAAAVADLNEHVRLLAVSAATRQFHLAEGLDPGKTVVVTNGVDLARFRPRRRSGTIHRQLHLPDDVPLIGTIGQISLRKGTDVLLQMMRRVAQRHRRVSFVLAGACYSQKEEARALERDLRRAATAELAGRLHLLGFRADVAELLPELALLVHPARQEPFGRVLLEAAASGVAVVATDVGGTGEVFPARTQSARLVGPDDPEQLAAAVLELLANPEQRRRLGQAARQQASKALDVRDAAAALVGQYQAVLDR